MSCRKSFGIMLNSSTFLYWHICACTFNNPCAHPVYIAMYNAQLNTRPLKGPTHHSMMSTHSAGYSDLEKIIRNRVELFDWHIHHVYVIAYLIICARIELYNAQHNTRPLKRPTHYSRMSTQSAVYSELQKIIRNRVELFNRPLLKYMCLHI